jgi:hypothetical protein
MYHSHLFQMTLLFIKKTNLVALLILGSAVATELRGTTQRDLGPACKHTGWNGIDNGCSSAKPHCVDASGKEVNVWNGAGDHCAVCINNQSPDSKWNPDKGCPGAKPFCLYTNGKQPGVFFEGNQCFADLGGVTPPCKNTGWGGIDNGCNSAKPHCVDASGKEVNVWDGAGDHCAVCINNQSPDSKWNPDKGCPGAKPFCLSTNGKPPGVNFEGNQCFAA